MPPQRRATPLLIWHICTPAHYSDIIIIIMERGRETSCVGEGFVESSALAFMNSTVQFDILIYFVGNIADVYTL